MTTLNIFMSVHSTSIFSFAVSRS